MTLAMFKLTPVCVWRCWRCVVRLHSKCESHLTLYVTLLSGLSNKKKKKKTTADEARSVNIPQSETKKKVIHRRCYCTSK